MANFYGNDPFFNNDMDDVFNQLFRRMDNQNSGRARYLVNGQSLTPDEFAQYRATGKLPQNNKTIEVSKVITNDSFSNTCICNADSIPIFDAT